jgi:UDP-N-acetylmuramyl tripeptide synthase
MSLCSNCKTTLSCGCQKKMASNGTPVCTYCISGYEVELKRLAAPKVVVPSTNTPPSNLVVNVFKT